VLTHIPAGAAAHPANLASLNALSPPKIATTTHPDALRARSNTGAALALALGTLTFAGCSIATVTSPAVTRHFTARVAAICADTNRNIEALPVPNDTPDSEAKVVHQVFHYVGVEFAKLDHLTAPRKQRRIFATALAATKALVAIDKAEAADYARAQLTEATALVNKGNPITELFDSSMSSLGVQQCAANPQPSAPY